MDVLSRRSVSRARPDRASCIVSDVHSQLNSTRVARIVRPRSTPELQEIVRRASRRGESISVCGGRHAMGGQQFAAGTTLVDMTGLASVIDVDPERGLATVGAGIDWVQLINHLLWTFPDPANAWGIIQKQTGADRLTIGGALSANIHGRGLRLQPFVADVESLTLVDPQGRLQHCSRTANPGLFALAAGGYGMFGAVATVTLRLARRRKLERRVAVVAVDDLPALFELRVREGYEFGDFQFATDPASREFLQTGVFSCYRPVPIDTPIPGDQRSLAPHEWRRLLRLAHSHKSQAFAEYARYYMATDGQVYWSDTHQLADYPDGYHADLDRELGAPVKGSEMITELYVPRPALPELMRSIRADARQYGTDIIYGTIRIIEEDDQAMLAWARQRWACVVFNLHVDHSPEGIETAAGHFRRLIDRAMEPGGSYYLTYHRWATAVQALACHPRLREFIAEKHRFDPAGVFTSDWFRHHERLLAGDP
jgi:FAD/FMN-containing dehydrogenase